MMVSGAYWLVLNTIEISLTNVQTLGYQQKLTNPELTMRKCREVRTGIPVEIFKMSFCRRPVPGGRGRGRARRG